MLHYTDEAIVEGIGSRDSSIIKYVYKEFYPTIKFLITTNSGSDTDAEDIFQDALIILFKKILEENLVLTSSFKTFLYSICRNLWLQRLDRKFFSLEFLELENISSLQDLSFSDPSEVEVEKYRLYQVHFLNLSEDCQKILRLFMNKRPLKEIAEVMGFKTEKYAKTRKFMCKEKLRNAILNDPNCKKFISDHE
jgi:RNA polymerase sigma factor (sigma-70 family)